VHRNRSSGGVCVDTAEATPVRFPERARSRGPPRSGPVKIRVRVADGPIAGLATEGHLSNVPRLHDAADKPEHAEPDEQPRHGRGRPVSDPSPDQHTDMGAGAHQPHEQDRALFEVRFHMPYLDNPQQTQEAGDGGTDGHSGRPSEPAVEVQQCRNAPPRYTKARRNFHTHNRT
jgi:hypothetical protein